jgi:O-antigen/teichoic acid export membrane protein
MNVIAWVSVVEVILKLLIVFVLQLFEYDNLKLYSVLVFTVTLIIRLIYGTYCSRNFAETKYLFLWNKPLFSTLISYASWNLWGNAAVALYGQGVNVLMNIFFGPALNAAAGIAYQVRGGLNGFVHNFQVAMNPQIIKSFASDDLKYLHNFFRAQDYFFFTL